MANTLQVYALGSRGVNVDKDPFQHEDQELTLAQNVISDPLGGELGLKNRPGFIEANAQAAAGSVVGGMGVPLKNLRTGVRMFYIGRGPK